MNREEYEFCKEQLIVYQKEEPLAVERIKAAEENLKKAKAELAEAEDNYAGIRGGIAIFISEIERYERKNEAGN